MTLAIEDRVKARLDALRVEGTFRNLRQPSGIDLASNDYLGLARHPFIRERMIAAIREGGCGSTGSRLLTGHRESFAAVERGFAELKGTERALYFSSGYLANLAVLTTFVEPGDLILSDRLNHASLRDGVRLARAQYAAFPHSDLRGLVELLDTARGRGQVFVLTESLFSMDGDVPPLAEYAAVCRAAGAALIVDEAHAVGIYGASGSGLIEETGIARDVFVSINTAGKALGVAGAFVAGPAWAIEYLVQRARPFMFSTAPPPALAAALEASLALIRSEPERRQRVRERSTRLRVLLNEAGITTAQSDSQIVPIVLGDVERTVTAAERLRAQGFDVRPIRPPSVPEGTARLRISVNVNLSNASLDAFVVSLAAALGETSRCQTACS